MIPQKPKYTFKGYDLLRPLKDNLSQLKNFLELIVAFIIAVSLPGIETFISDIYGGDIAAQFVVIINTLEVGFVYYILSAIEFFLKDE